MDNKNTEARTDDQLRQEQARNDWVEDAAEGLWLRLRDIVLVHRQLERFVF